MLSILFLQTSTPDPATERLRETVLDSLENYERIWVHGFVSFVEKEQYESAKKIFENGYKIPKLSEIDAAVERFSYFCDCFYGPSVLKKNPYSIAECLRKMILSALQNDRESLLNNPQRNFWNFLCINQNWRNEEISEIFGSWIVLEGRLLPYKPSVVIAQDRILRNVFTVLVQPPPDENPT